MGTDYSKQKTKDFQNPPKVDLEKVLLRLKKTILHSHCDYILVLFFLNFLYFLFFDFFDFRFFCFFDFDLFDFEVLKNFEEKLFLLLLI